MELKPPSLNAVCCHAQQRVEKYFKAVPQENDIAFQKAHDLEVLLDQCLQFIPKLEKLRDDAQTLNVFAVEVRYPGFDAEQKDAKRALASMRVVVEVVKGYFLETD